MIDMSGSGTAARRVVPVLAAAFLALAFVVVLGPAGKAAADLAPEKIDELAVTFRLRTDGSMHVTERIVYDFGGASGRHGILRTFPRREADASDTIRLYPLSHVKVSSPSGAPSDVDVQDDRSTTTIRVGDPDRTVSGVQTYLLQYDVDGVVTTTATGQELYWNALGLDTGVPVQVATVTVTGPGGDVQRATCFEGADRGTDPCRWEIDGRSATFRASRPLKPYEGLTVVAGFPTGTFTGAGPILERRWKVLKVFTATPETVGVSVVVLILLVGGAVTIFVRRGLDRRYLDLAPGFVPEFGQDARTGPVVRRRRATVRSTPPEGVRVGLLGTLLDKRADAEDITATIIDLAIRKHLRIEKVPPSGPGGKPDWALERTGRSTGDLRPYELSLLTKLAPRKGTVLLSSLRTMDRGALVPIKESLCGEVTGQRWFTGDPETARTSWYGAAFMEILLGALFILGVRTSNPWSLVGLASILAGPVTALLGRWAPARTAAGTAVLDQLRGFRSYLKTVGAEELRSADGEDVFSRYLPYAIILGLEKRWSGVFAELAASGRPFAAPTWLHGDGLDRGAGLDHRRFHDSVRDFSAHARSAIAAPASSSWWTSSGSGGSSSYGSSGFSGGSSGDGGGGGGVSSW